MRRRWLRCACGARGDMKDPTSLFGWQTVPSAVCAECIQKEMERRAAQVQKPMVPVIERSTYFGKTISTLNFVQE